MESAVVFVLLAALAAADGPARPAVARLGESFTLHPGQSARIESENVEIEFERVVSDSRCPKGEQCLVEGDAVVRVAMRKGGTRTSYDLHTSERAEQEASGDGLTFLLVRLDPYPVKGKAIAPEDYAATLQVTRAPSDPAAR